MFFYRRLKVRYWHLRKLTLLACGGSACLYILVVNQMLLWLNNQTEPLQSDYHAVIMDYKTNMINQAVNPVPAIANFSFDKTGLDKPCSVVRMVDYMGSKLALTGSPLCQWLEQPARISGGNFYCYGKEMALLYDVIVDPLQRQAGARGGEDISEVWGQPENQEYIVMKPGYFLLSCSAPPQVVFNGKNHLNNWTSAVRCHRCALNNHWVSSSFCPQDNSVVPGLTLALQRYDYANIYFVVLNLYNSFLAALAFNADPKNITVLLVDAHPKGSMDAVWETLFDRVIRAGRLPRRTRFAAMAWIAKSHNSPLRQLQAPKVNYLEEFRDFVLRGHGVNDTRVLNCSSVHILFIWRRDYLAHPRNKAGTISRKIANEEEIFSAVVNSSAYRNDRLEGQQLDALPLREQLQLVADTDLLVAMHGAGLVHSLFLPAHGSVVEFYPKNFPHTHQPFRAIASWRGLHYVNWKNTDSKLENKQKGTYIPPDIVVKLVSTVRQKMCEDEKDD